MDFDTLSNPNILSIEETERTLQKTTKLCKWYSTESLRIARARIADLLMNGTINDRQRESLSIRGYMIHKVILDREANKDFGSKLKRFTFGTYSPNRVKKDLCWVDPPKFWFY